MKIEELKEKLAALIDLLDYWIPISEGENSKANQASILADELMDCFERFGKENKL